MAAEIPQFGCFSSQGTSPAGSVFLSDIGPDGQVTRRRRVHTKSRTGCTGCKARKVKCDEEQPCRNCIRRDQECIQNPTRSPTTSKKPTPPTLSSHSRGQITQKVSCSSLAGPSPELTPVNKEHLLLLHHFETFTSKTFIIEPEIWKNSVIKLALENEFLMHAIFAITAAHLQHLQPQEKRYRIVALQSLSQVLPVFRNAIGNIAKSNEYSVEMGEALLACSMLLLQCAWDSGSEISHNHNLSGFYHGVASIIEACIHRVNGGFLFQMLNYSPRRDIEQCMKSSGAVCNNEGVFRHILTCTIISDIQPENPSTFNDPVQGLSAILWALDSDRNGELGLEFAAARYLFTSPLWFPDPFVSLVKANDGRARAFLLYFFAAISKLRSERFWWMRKRALYLFGEISSSLGNKCTECTDRAHEIFRGED